MSVTIPIGLALFLAAMVAMGWRSDPRGERRAASLLRRVVKRFDPDEAYIGRAGFGVIGLSSERRTLILGDARRYDEYPFEKILAVEGLRDGVVLKRTARDEPTALTPQIEQPERIRTLSLRITLDDPDRPIQDIAFLDEPRRGVSPSHRVFLSAAHEIEAWHRRVSGLIEPDAPVT